MALYNRSNLGEACYRMATRGGYILSFAKTISCEIPDLKWEEFRTAILNNGNGFCGYGEQAVRNSFGR
jgi:hypothetical protein